MEDLNAEVGTEEAKEDEKSRRVVDGSSMTGKSARFGNGRGSKGRLSRRGWGGWGYAMARVFQKRA